MRWLEGIGTDNYSGIIYGIGVFSWCCCCKEAGADTRGTRGLGGPVPPFSIVVGVSRPYILPGGLRSFYSAQAAPRIPRFSLV